MPDNYTSRKTKTKLEDLMARVKHRFEEIAKTLITFEAASNPPHGIQFDKAIQEALDHVFSGYG